MIDELRSLAGGDQGAWQQLAEERALVRGLRAAVELDDEMRLRECRRLLSGENVPMLIGRYYAADRKHIDIERLHRNGMGLVNAALAAGALRRKDWAGFLECWDL